MLTNLPRVIYRRRVETLADYLKASSQTPKAFAKRINRAHGSVLRYLAGERRPDWETLKRIFRATGGRVKPESFFESPRQSVRAA